MANELRINMGVTYANGAMADTVSASFSANQAALAFQGDIVSVGTSEQDLTVANITTLGWVYVKNLDPANYVQFGPKSAGAMVVFGRILAGESALLRLEPSITLRWVANTAAVKMLVKVFNN